MIEKSAGSLSSRIKELRKERGMKQSELAKVLHISQQAIGSWETGRTIPGADTLNDLADIFNVTTDYLLGRPNKQEIKKDDVELSDDDVIMTWRGKPLSDEDRELIRRIMNGK